MRPDEVLVGTIALTLAAIAMVIASGPWQAPYELRTIKAVLSRFGKPAARGVWFLVAFASLIAGVSILGGFRPSYAVPAHTTQANP